MTQEEINDLMWASCPEWKKEQLQPQRYSQDELLREVNAAIDSYDKKREIVSKILQKEGFEEAIIDELEAMGFEVI